MNKNEELLPYYEKARELLKYNPDTGELTWVMSRSSRAIKDSVAGQKTSQGYWCVGITINRKQKLLKAHRVIWFIVHGELPNVIDHIDEDKVNNKISNLRSCTSQENQFNKSKPSNNTSGYKGVSFRKDNGKFRAMIRINDKLIHLSQYDTAKEASEAYEEKAKELHGKFYYNN